MFYQQIIKVYADSKGIYGAPKITAILNRQGVDCSVSTVSRSMNLLGIRSIVAEKFKKKKSSLSGEERKSIVNLTKDLPIKHIKVITEEYEFAKNYLEKA